MSSAYTPLPIAASIELQHQILKPPSDHYLDEFDLDEEFDELPFLNAAPSAPAGSGVSGAVFNLATSIIGAGIMALPAAMKVLGIGLGSLLILLMGLLSEVSIEILVRFSVHCKSKTYGDIVETTFGFTAKIVAEVCIIINNAGILVVYLIIIGDVMSGSENHVGVLDQLFGTGVWDFRKLVILIVLVVCLAPLCSLEKIDSLSLTSAASVGLAVVFVVVCCVIAGVKIVEGGIRTPRLGPDFGSKAAVLDLLVVVPIMTNAYVCHFNVQPIYNELEGRSPEKMNRVGRVTTALCIAVYGSTAISGYLLFGDDIESDVLTNFDRDLGIRYSTILNYVVRIGYVLHLVLVFPVVHFSLRQTVGGLVFKQSDEQSRKRTLLLTTVLLGLIYFGSTTIPNIWVAFKFTGATTGLSLGFIFPALIALRLDKQGKSLTCGERMLSWLMLVLAVVASIVGVVGNIYSIKSQTN